MTAKRIWNDFEVGYLRDNYFLQDYREISLALGISISVISRKAKEIGLPDKTERNKIEHRYRKPIDAILKTLHIQKRISVNQMASRLGVSRRSITRWMDEFGIVRRGRSEAGKLKWQQMTKAERQYQVAGAHRKNAELLRSGNHAFQRWWSENRDEATKWARLAAPLGSIERERRGNNGMLGKRGVAHHNWKGGKDEYHRLRSVVPGDWSKNRKLALERDKNTCQDCGVKNKKVIIDVHHIVSLRKEGTNKLDNLITLCRPCHQKLEWEERNS